MQDQDTRSRGVVQARPGQLDLLQLAQHLAAEVLDGAVVAGFGRVCAELAVQLLPREPLRSTEREGAMLILQVLISRKRRESRHDTDH